VYYNTNGSLALSLPFHTSIAVIGLFLSDAGIVPFITELLTLGVVAPVPHTPVVVLLNTRSESITLRST